MDKLFVYDRSEEYAMFRPSYPSQLLEKALAATAGRNFCLDIATGTG
jgi:trans-aconitate methyltransferase